MTILSTGQIDLDRAIKHWLAVFNEKRRQHIGVTYEDGHHIIDWLEGYGPRIEALLSEVEESRAEIARLRAELQDAHRLNNELAALLEPVDEA